MTNACARRCNQWRGPGILHGLALAGLALVGCGGEPGSKPDPATDAMVTDGNAPPGCGDGIVQDPEECDDGNTLPDDGCSTECTREAGFTCVVPNAPCERCGNGIVESSESCDDSNRDAGDGCSDACAIEGGGWACPVPGEPCERCGDGVVDPNERCDEGTFTDGVGCSVDCRTIGDFYTCSIDGGEPCALCGDGIPEGDEACDDGNNASGDGCVYNCRVVEAGWVCPALGGVCTLCGNGLLEGVEVCDDGNFVSDDGCSSACVLEPGAVCVFEGELCSLCGNGVVEVIAVDDQGTVDPGDDTYSLEPCDDGNVYDGDGCSSACVLDPDYDCSVPGVLCSLCGDGVRQPLESCDDGLSLSTGMPAGGDGCSADCTTEEPFYDCPVDGQPCERCGDGVRDEHEACDDGVRAPFNVPVSGDGCTRDCKRVETGWACFEAPDGTFLGCNKCGNRLKEYGEACDDGNTVGGDGCAADCTDVEDDFNCFIPGFPCVVCGNGDVEPGEECDEGHLANPANKTAGCNVFCRIVDPWACPAENSSCELCGDGAQGVFEECDDGNTNNDDGCTAACEVEPGYDCTTLPCVAAACGDGFVAGAEECDDGNEQAGDGCSFICDVEQGWVCPAGVNCRRFECGDGVVEGDEECDDGNVLNDDGCDSNCQIEIGFQCPIPDHPCIPSICGNAVIEGAEQCDDANNAAPGCDADCQLEDGFHCPILGAACEPTVCGDGLVQGTEACDDGNVIDTDGCLSDCTEDPLYHCENEPSECKPIVEFVAIRRYQASNVNPAGVLYNPERRSFGAHKAPDSQDPIELCLDGTVLNPSDGACPNGCQISPDGLTSTDLPPSCADVPTPDPCYTYPLRPTMTGTLVGGTLDTFTPEPTYLFVTTQGGNVYLYQVPLDYDDTTQVATDFDVELTEAGTAGGIAVGEDGDLYLADNGTDSIVVYPRRRDGDLAVILPDCVATPEANCTSFDPAPTASGWSAPSVDPLTAIFTVPGEDLIGIFNHPSGLGSYTGIDMDGSPLSVSEYFTFYRPSLAADPPLFDRSELPGELFQLGSVGFSFTQEGKAAATAPDGGSFLICPAVPAEMCQLYAHTCENDTDCANAVPGTRCNLLAGIPYCHAPGEARNDRYAVAVNSTGSVLTVLENDSLSESACLDPTMKIVAIDTTGTAGEIVGFVPGDTELVYDAPAGGACGFVDMFDYTADLGGGFLDDATVRVVIECDCGDAIVQGNEQCDLGDGQNGAPPARCSLGCQFNVICGDTFRDPGEECDDGNSMSGDGCSEFCTLETICGDGLPEGVEECDDGNNTSGDGCNGDCTLPVCGDGSLDLDVAEQCDDGNRVNNDGCSSLCEIETDCGNFLIELGEQCDDGNQVPGDGCSAACTLEGDCGDGTIAAGTEECDPAYGGTQCAGLAMCMPICLCENYCGDGRVGGLEQCDDGANGVAGDGCRDNCTAEVCGDAIVDPGEECDDGNLIPADGCTNACVAITICGNGITEVGEDCDDGNNRSGDGCSSACRSETTACGDGTVDFNEQCDDGNTVSGDGCSEFCRYEGGVCGNGTVEPGEQCDDGNNNNGDGCDALCMVEVR